MHQQLPSIGPIHGQLAAPVPPDRHELAEEMAWVHLYRAVRQPPGAAEVVKYLNSNPEARSRHEALYLIACETLHAKALADEQSERTVAAVRAIFVTAPISVLQLATALVVAIPRIFSGKSTVDPKASRPKTGASRAKARVDVLAKHPEVAEVITGFAASPSTAPATPEAPAAAEAPASRGGQAA
ncbi:hypothetical protein [uncultured Piscinibacter sp.]|uniref:hypothetical protein n=1 Tax=uncultured Piscinibacter sp. TaxID=1131835 RepID=UPI00261D5002|nr:hypothetical protein [uncultured Piscinibacter sp.]